MSYIYIPTRTVRRFELVPASNTLVVRIYAGVRSRRLIFEGIGLGSCLQSICRFWVFYVGRYTKNYLLIRNLRKSENRFFAGYTRHRYAALDVPCCIVFKVYACLSSPLKGHAFHMSYRQHLYHTHLHTSLYSPSYFRKTVSVEFTQEYYLFIFIVA